MEKNLKVIMLILFALSLIPMLSPIFLIGALVIAIILLTRASKLKNYYIVELVCAGLGLIPIFGYIFRIIGLITSLLVLIKK
ncbi:MAG: hypothetical protein AB1571_00060 [Nanoarchaeota archaeon]